MKSVKLVVIYPRPKDVDAFREYLPDGTCSSGSR